MTSSPHPATSRPDWSFPGDHAAISAPAAIALFFGSPRPRHGGPPPAAQPPRR
ncbi:hypothetical protein [Streptomyces spinosus]|uniref:hypothetical protein n=1 Tax=Streptomyces spinosus TaxID=2872623 RepID=UPI001CEC8E29|nr:hypothetical protein [Streptomyces spinosus]